VARWQAVPFYIFTPKNRAEADTLSMHTANSAALSQVSSAEQASASARARVARWQCSAGCPLVL
jgi:hypothetical protein